MKVVVASLFRDSAERVPSYFAESDALGPAVVGHVAVEGDSVDNTHALLVDEVQRRPMVVVKKDYGTPRFGNVCHPVRFQVLARCANSALDTVLTDFPEADYLLWRESDVIIPPNLLRLAARERDIIAPMVMHNKTGLFYDTFAFRRGDDPKLQGPCPDMPTFGCFQKQYPYHPCYRSFGLFEVDSAGSVMLVKTKWLREGVRMSEEDGIVGFCRQARGLGARVWVDPSITVVHP